MRNSFEKRLPRGSPFFLTLLAALILIQSCGEKNSTYPLLREWNSWLTPSGQVSDYKIDLFSTTADAVVEGAGAASTAIVEPDIYRFSSDWSVLYAANPYRGLAAFDVSDPETPKLKGSLKFAGTPKEMYLRDGCIVLLVEPTYSYYSYYYAEGSSPTCKAIFVSLASGATEMGILGEIEFQGSISILDSRLLESGSDAVLLVATNDGWKDGAVSSSTTELAGAFSSSMHSIDPDSRSLLSSFEFPGYSTAIHVGESDVFAASSWIAADPAKSLLTRYTVAADGSLNAAGSVRIPGLVQDRFKLDFDEAGQTLRAVSLDSSSGWSTRLTKAFAIDWSYPSSVPEPASGSILELAPGEGQYASRFDGDLCYIVTYLTKDPLFVVSFAEGPGAKPAELSRLTIPGYSTHIEVVDTGTAKRLFAVGVSDRWQAKVSWFDASNPASISQIGADLFLGAESGWSYSSANWDWKRLNKLPELSAFAVPYAFYDSSSYLSECRVALVRYADAGISLLCELPDSGDALRTIPVPGSGDLVYTYADDRLQGWRISGNSATKTGEAIIAENVLWADVVDGKGVKVVQVDSDMRLRVFDPGDYAGTGSQADYEFPSALGAANSIWYKFDPDTVAKAGSRLFFLGHAWNSANSESSLVLVPVDLSAYPLFGAPVSLKDTAAFSPFQGDANGSRFLPSPEGKLLVFHGSLTMLDSGSLSKVWEIENPQGGMNAFYRDGIASCFTYSSFFGREEYCSVTLSRYAINGNTPIKTFAGSFPGYPLHDAGGGRYISAFTENIAEGGTVFICSGLSGNSIEVLSRADATDAVRSTISQGDFFACAFGGSKYYYYDYIALSARAAARDSGEDEMKVLSIKVEADGSLAMGDPWPFGGAGWTSAFLMDSDRLAFRSGNDFTVFSVASLSISGKVLEESLSNSWTTVALSISGDYLYVSSGMGGISRYDIR